MGGGGGDEHGINLCYNEERSLYLATHTTKTTSCSSTGEHLMFTMRSLCNAGAAALTVFEEREATVITLVNH